MVDKVDTSSATGLDKGAIYYEVSPYIILTLRFYNVMVFIMVVISIALCVVKGDENKANYLLVANLVLSGLVAIVVNWWYRGGDLSSDKHWFIFLLGGIIILQCITTDIYAFHVPPSSASNIFPGSTRTMPHTAFTWATINTSTLLPPTTRVSSLLDWSGSRSYVWF